MPKPLCFLAQLTGLNPLNPAAPIGKSTGLVFMDVMAIIATGLALSLILLLWARYHVRKKKLRHHRNERAAVSDPAPLLADEEDPDGPHHGRRRRRRRHRREHRPRNPTLSETGGLPPPRTEPSSNPPL